MKQKNKKIKHVVYVGIYEVSVNVNLQISGFVVRLCK